MSRKNNSIEFRPNRKTDPDMCGLTDLQYGDYNSGDLYDFTDVEGLFNEKAASDYADRIISNDRPFVGVQCYEDNGKQITRFFSCEDLDAFENARDNGDARMPDECLSEYTFELMQPTPRDIRLAIAMRDFGAISLFRDEETVKIRFLDKDGERSLEAPLGAFEFVNGEIFISDILSDYL